MIDLANQGMVIAISIGWAYLGLLILNPPDGKLNILSKIVASGLFAESFFVLWVGLTRPPYGKSLGFLGLGIALWFVNSWVYRSQRRNNGAIR